MDDLFRRRKQHDDSMRPHSDPRYHQPGQESSQQRQFSQSGPAAADRQRMTQDGVRAMSGGSSSVGYGGYYQETQEGTFSAGPSVSQGAMGYAHSVTDYAHDTRQTQGFASSYNPSGAGMMYGVQQAGVQPPVFDAAQPFPSRHHGGMQMMAADMASTPYFAGESAGPSVALHTQGAASSTSSTYQHQGTPDSRHGAVASYGGGGITVPITGISGLASQATGNQEVENAPTAAIAAGTAANSQDYADTQEAYASYQATLKDIFRRIKAKELAPAGESLLEISEWLLTRVESLGLTVDDEELYKSRLKLWQNFNNAWLGLLQRQKEIMWYRKNLGHSESLVSFADLQRMARELVRLCDGVERFGLVDYDYGVWEERIMAVLTECVDLYSMAEDEAAGAATSRQSSRQG